MFIHPFKPFKNFLPLIFTSKETVWWIVPVFDDSHKEGILKGVNFNWSVLPKTHEINFFVPATNSTLY